MCTTYPCAPTYYLEYTYFFFPNCPLATAQLNATSQLLYVRQREYVLLGAFWTMVCCPCPNPSPNPELVPTLTLTHTLSRSRRWSSSSPRSS